MGKLRRLDIFNKDFLIIIFIVLTTSWTWRILNYNIFLCLLLIFVTAIFLKLLLINKLHTLLILILCLAFLIVAAVNLHLGFDQGLYKLNFNEEVQLNERHKYYAGELGKFFLNRYALNYYKNYNPYFYKFQQNIFSVLDSNLYFFASHPRERSGVNEFEKFPSLYLIFFVIGIIYSFRLRLLLIMLYLLAAVLVSGLISPAFELGPILFFPFVATLTILGVIWLINQIHRI